MDFSFTTSNLGDSPATFARNEGQGAKDYTVVPAANGSSYSIAESDKSGWQLTDLDCYSGASGTTAFAGAHVL